MTDVATRSTITCPNCGRTNTEDMATNSCCVLFVCDSCNTVLRPKPGDCCVFCSYGDVVCPPVQIARGTGEPTGCCT